MQQHQGIKRQASFLGNLLRDAQEVDDDDDGSSSSGSEATAISDATELTDFESDAGSQSAREVADLDDFSGDDDEQDTVTKAVQQCVLSHVH